MKYIKLNAIVLFGIVAVWLAVQAAKVRRMLEKIEIKTTSRKDIS